MKSHNPTSISPPLGRYNHGISAPSGGRWLHIAGQIGLRPDGSLAEGFAAQAEAVWQNLTAILADAGMTPVDLVKVNHYLVRHADLADYNPVRARFLGDACPASTLLVVQALARTEWLIEVDAVAWRA